MAQTKVKKGILFYLGTLAVLFLAVFLILMCIMIFSPGTSVFGMEYFTNKGTVKCIKDETGAVLGDLTSYDVIEVSGSYSKIIVDKNNRYKSSNDGSVLIKNNAKGFVRSKKANDFSYSIKTSVEEGGIRKLKVSVVEQTGFMYFSKDVAVIINLGNEERIGANVTETKNFDNTKFVFKTTSGDIEIGGIDTNNAGLINIQELKATTTKGDIRFTSMANPVIGSIDLKTKSGDVRSGAQFTSGGKKVGLSITNEAKISTTSGQIELDNVYVANGLGTLDLTCTGGRLICDNINANLDIRCQRGNYTVGHITGNVSLDKSQNDIESPIITMDQIDGDLHIPNGGSSKINIHEVKGKTYIKTKNGYVKIGGKTKKNGYGGATGEVFVETVKGDIDVYFTASNVGANNILTKSGEVELNYLGGVNGLNNVTVKGKGEVTVNFTTQSAMLIELRNAEGTIYSKKAKNIKYSLESGVPNSNPCYINCDEDSCVNELYIKCDKEICLNTVKF
ncbi:MAG: hypothetical protein IJ008_01630 [Clostridia bacterium]|nr:hypothetical protein [Clostridia bacterium]